MTNYCLHTEVEHTVFDNEERISFDTIQIRRDGGEINSQNWTEISSKPNVKMLNLLHKMGVSGQAWSKMEIIRKCHKKDIAEWHISQDFSGTLKNIRTSEIIDATAPKFPHALGHDENNAYSIPTRRARHEKDELRYKGDRDRRIYDTVQSLYARQYVYMDASPMTTFGQSIW